MIHTFFSVYDEKAQAFLPPFTLPRPGIAIRTFTDCVNDPTHAFGKHPSDYTLFRLGTFNDENGKITMEKSAIANGIEYLHPELADTPSDLPTQQQLGEDPAYLDGE